MARISVAILALAVAQTASAAGPGTGSVSARLEVRAEASCAVQSDVVASVARRSARIRFVTDDSDVLRFRASVRASDKGEFVAELSVVQASGRHSSRRFLVKSCAEAVDALALVLVMTLDPESSALGEGAALGDASEASAEGKSAAQGTAGRGSNADGAAAPSSTTKAASTATAGANSTASRPNDADTDADTAAEAEATAAATSPRSDLTLGAVAQGLTGLAPSLMPGIAAQALWVLERGSAWSPAARLSAGYHWLGGVRASGGIADFELPLFALELCPLVLGPRGVALRPCAFGAVGPLSAAGSDTLDPQHVTRPFAALGASLLAIVDIGSKLQLSGNASVGANLVTDTFAFDPNVFHEVPGVSVLVGLGVGYRFSVIE